MSKPTSNKINKLTTRKPKLHPAPEVEHDKQSNATNDSHTLHDPADSAPRAGRCCRARPTSCPAQGPLTAPWIPSQNAEFSSDPALRNPRLKQKGDSRILQNPTQEHFAIKSQVLTKAEKVNDVRKQASSTWARRAQAINLIGMNPLFLTCEQCHQISKSSERGAPSSRGFTHSNDTEQGRASSCQNYNFSIAMKDLFSISCTINKVQDLRVLKNE